MPWGANFPCYGSAFHSGERRAPRMDCFCVDPHKPLKASLALAMHLQRWRLEAECPMAIAKPVREAIICSLPDIPCLPSSHSKAGHFEPCLLQTFVTSIKQQQQQQDGHSPPKAGPTSFAIVGWSHLYSPPPPNPSVAFIVMLYSICSATSAAH